MVVEVKERACEVLVAGRRSETEGFGFFFPEGFWRYICSEGKNDEKNPPSTDLQLAIRG